jgi:hypothetical protein
MFDFKEISLDKESGRKINQHPRVKAFLVEDGWDIKAKILS